MGEEDMNELFLWHGSSHQVALSIVESEFKQPYAGSATGTLYGPGTYFTDSCTKADEYAKPDETDTRVMLLCRVMCGRMRYNDEAAPDAAALTRNVLQGPYDSVYGDREKCRGTFKEIVIYESNQAYPEYLVYYKRCFEEFPAL